MKVLNIQENEDGSADIFFEFNNDEEYQIFKTTAKERDMDVDDLLLDIIKKRAEEVLNSPEYKES